ncbi:hypothetical protein CERZMDRAFT_91495 [Cercospora zeae-maydis SCOH1-5]|uniref:Uncharacterized protein n=1 Tax=Cercospora zeae-maydis SCOH1-5 TaxID=717836 RepID=A0A6A6F5U7_9PEZI|nr:hypothetical protein CERZMDRAFT_91495 [Cercospora zeae-maydis SCOH1-5]
MSKEILERLCAARHRSIVRSLRASGKPEIFTGHLIEDRAVLSWAQSQVCQVRGGRKVVARETPSSHNER